jgi:hypothetical protein
MCFALRLHMSAAPPQGGLTQALGGIKALRSFCAPQLWLTGFGQCRSSDWSRARCFFGLVRQARSHVACVALAGFGKDDHYLMTCRA